MSLSTNQIIVIESVSEHGPHFLEMISNTFLRFKNNIHDIGGGIQKAFCKNLCFQKIGIASKFWWEEEKKDPRQWRMPVYFCYGVIRSSLYLRIYFKTLFSEIEKNFK